MIWRSLIISAALTAFAANPASAEVRELEQVELREFVQSGKSLGRSKLMQIVSTHVEGDLVDIRAFEGEGIHFRVLVKRPDGKIAAVILDAQTGVYLPSSSTVAKQVMKAAKSDKGAKNRGKKGKSGGNGNGNGNGNGGGNGGGNGNGNGN